MLKIEDLVKRYRESRGKMEKLTISDCLKLHKQGVSVVINDGKINSFITPKNDNINADMFFYYFLDRGR